MLQDSGYAIASDPETADVVMVNTCAFIEEARKESVETILDVASVKRSDAKLVVMGCMAQRYEQELIEALPEADAVIGLGNYSGFVGEIDDITGWQPVEFKGFRRSNMDILDVVRRPTPTTPFAYVKVAEGCNKTCGFCAIPLIRGKQRSRSDEGIVQEIEGLVQGGVAEIVIVAQDLAAYGRDEEGREKGAGSIVSLVEKCASVDGLGRLRLYYLFPREIRQELIDIMVGHETIADYFDLSLQHSSSRLLRSMRRPGSGETHLELIGRIRSGSPDAAMRSSFVVGYPGETEDDLENLADFLVEAQLDWAGFFPFSKEEGTHAETLPDQLPREVINERMRHLQELQDGITAARNAATVGRTLSILVDQVEDGQAVGRSYREAPEIDGMILLDRGTAGEWVTAKIEGAYGTDLMAIVAPT